MHGPTRIWSGSESELLAVFIAVIPSSRSYCGRCRVAAHSPGGRAGRHGKQWDFGEVTCLKDEDMGYMRQVTYA